MELETNSINKNLIGYLKSRKEYTEEMGDFINISHYIINKKLTKKRKKELDFINTRLSELVILIEITRTLEKANIK